MPANDLFVMLVLRLSGSGTIFIPIAMRINKVVRIGVIGTINRDTIIHPDGRRIESYGGILYNLKVLSDLFDQQAALIPAVNIGSDCEKEITTFLDKFNNLSGDAIRIVNKKNNHCILTYHNNSEKSEILLGGVGAVSRKQLSQLIDCDIILLNFISGSDITFSNLTWLRHNSKADIHLDLHSRTLGLHRNGSRFLRKPPRWQEYVNNADYLQMNEQEFNLLSGVQVTADSCRNFFTSFFPHCRALIVTAGANGCYLTLPAGKNPEFRHIPTVQANVMDTTGCGDIFSSAFIYARLCGLDMEKSATLAVKVSSCRTSVSIFNQLDFTQLRIQD